MRGRATNGSRRERSWKVPSPTELELREKPTLGYRLWRVAVLKPFCRFLFNIKIEGRELLPQGQYAFVANHSGMWDAALLLDALPASPQVHFLGDPSSILRFMNPASRSPKNLALAAGARLFWIFLKRGGGIIPVDRTVKSNYAVRERLDEAVAQGCVTGAFPERTYIWRYFEGPDGLLDFTAKGEYHAAANAGIPLVPITISGAQRVCFRKKIIISFNKPFDSTKMSVDEMLEQTRPVIASRLVRNVPCRKVGIERLHLFERWMNAPVPRTQPPRALSSYYPGGAEKPVTMEYKPRSLS